MKLFPIVVQDYYSKQVLSLVYADKTALAKTRQTGFLWRYSRKFKKVLKKGATSGNTQEIVSLKRDCDKDAFLAVVKQNGSGACHLPQYSCFEKEKQRPWEILDDLINVIRSRRLKPTRSYTSRLLKNKALIAQKLCEEASELADALSLDKKEVVWEAADLLYFTLAALENARVDVEEVLEELRRRRK